MICPKCGNKQPDGTKFCINCGTKLNAAAQNMSRFPQNNLQPPNTYQNVNNGPGGWNNGPHGQDEKFWQKSWVMWVCLFLLPPVGIFLCYINRDRHSKWKIICGVFAFLFILGMIAPKSDRTKTDTPSTVTQEQASNSAADAAEKERIKAEKKAEKERLKAEKKAEEERLKAEKKAEKERLEATKKAEREQERANKEKAEIEGHDYTAVNINTLLADLEGNAARAHRTYKDQYVKIVGGTVKGIESDADYFTLDVPGGFGLTAVQCYPKTKVAREQIYQLYNNQPVTVYGKITKAGEIMGYRLDLLKIE